jgi:hypothetical protein
MKVTVSSQGCEPSNDTKHSAREAVARVDREGVARADSGKQLLFTVLSIFLCTEFDPTLDHGGVGRISGCNSRVLTSVRTFEAYIAHAQSSCFIPFV